MNKRKNTLAFLSLFFVLFLLFVEIFADDLIVKLRHGGKIIGTTLQSQKGKTIYSFRGIPYAEPPIGALRFKAPVPKSPWTGHIIDATKDGFPCTQREFLSTSIIGEEDCLYLNVFTTQHPANANNGSKIPVMIWIHGGAFEMGSSSSDSYGPGLLLDEDVILVAMNYRLGPMGFLSTGDSASAGNYGLMDQSLALKWVNDNIDSFGGDVTRITIFGESAGGASVGFHLLSPMSKGLFQAAIAQSGTPLSYWAIQKHPLYWTKNMSSAFQCPIEDNFEMVECLREIPAVDIIARLSTYRTTPFVPTVDGKFLPMEPKQILISGRINKVPYLSGLNKDEGLMTYVGIYLSSNISTIKRKIEPVVQYMLDDLGRADEATKLVMEKYFSHVDWSDRDETRRAIVKASTDASFSKMHYQMVKLLNQNGFPTYTYSLDYAPSVSIVNIVGINETWGVCHADDLGFLFDGTLRPLKHPTKDDKKIMKVFCSLWTNFAKYRNPTPKTTQDVPLKWELSTDSKMEIFHIDNPVTTSTYDVDKDDLFHFWTETIPDVLNRTVPKLPFSNDACCNEEKGKKR